MNSEQSTANSQQATINGLVRGWKGAASSVMWVLLVEEAHPEDGAHPADGMTAVELERATGYSDKPVRQALIKLEAMGLVAHHGKRRGWRMSKKGRREILRALVGKSVNSQRSIANGKRGR